jgi:hypothetical protein
VLHPDDQSPSVTVQPPLAAGEDDVVAGLAGVGPGPRWVWPGQPGRRSPWLPCASGCCLVLEARPGADPVEWLRFLVREVLAPVAREPRDRARRLGLPGGHRVEGQVLLDGVVRPRLLVAAGRRVRVVSVDDDPFPHRPVPVTPARDRGRGEVVPMDVSRRQTTER